MEGGAIEPDNVVIVVIATSPFDFRRRVQRFVAVAVAGVVPAVAVVRREVAVRDSVVVIVIRTVDVLRSQSGPESQKRKRQNHRRGSSRDANHSGSIEEVGDRVNTSAVSPGQRPVTDTAGADDRPRRPRPPGIDGPGASCSRLSRSR